MKKRNEKIRITDLIAGDIVRLKVFNPKNKKEWSLYRIKITADAYKGGGLGMSCWKMWPGIAFYGIDEDVFLEKTTGYEEE